MLTLITGGEVYAPEPRGVQDVLVMNGTVARVGDVDRGALERLGLPVEVLDARGALVVPGKVDPHAHLVGTGGEQGHGSRTEEVSWEELVAAGVTTVVGCLGTDSITRTLPTLLGRIRTLRALGLCAFGYTGAFQVPTPTLTGFVRSDLVFIPEFIGVGEVAISDFRATEPTAHELARLASDALVGGLLSQSAGVVHFHVGPGSARLRVLREVLDGYEVPARHLYPTHINRSDALVEEAVALAHRGAWVDMDCIERGQSGWVRKFLERGGPPDKLSLSSDAHCPDGYEHRLHEEFVATVHEKVLPLERALALVTRNPADALKLPHKGRVEAGADGDLLVLERDGLAVRDVVARGRVLLRDGRLQKPAPVTFEVP